jgi:hypothetical protein
MGESGGKGGFRRDWSGFAGVGFCRGMVLCTVCTGVWESVEKKQILRFAKNDNQEGGW